MTSRRLVLTLWILGGFALLLGFAREPLLRLIPRPRELPRADGKSGIPWVSGDFVVPGDPQVILPGRLPDHIQRASTWIEGDHSQGRAESAWFRARRMIIHVGVAGYPRAGGCAVWAEFQMEDGRVQRIDCPLPDPREEWDVWEIRRPRGAVAVRVVAEDRSSAYAAWVAFSHPFRAWPGVIVAGYQSLQVIATTGLALALVFGPGLFWNRREVSPERQLAALLATGPLTVAVSGILIWCASGWLRPQITGLVLVAGLWLSLGFAARRARFALPANPALRRSLALAALVVVAVVAKSAFSVGPPGELYQGAVSRNLELSDRIDSRFSFYTVQAAAHHWGPASDQAGKFFAPWTFFSRGPVAGLAAIPIVMATNGHPPEVLPENRWSPFDGTGFAAYRITMIALSSSIIIALVLALVPIVGERWATLAGGLLALTPFLVHEVMFTWPKWPSTAWLLASLAFAQAGKLRSAGVAAGIGFLFHPLALLWSPWVALWAARRNATDMKAAARALLRFGVGAASLVIPWMALGTLTPRLPEASLAGQAGFLRYWVLADWHLATWDSWWRTRWMNFANTFVPLHLYFDEASFNHPKLGSAYEKSGTLVKLAELWWTSLPFGMGLALWTLSLVALSRFLWRYRMVALLLVIGPALFITAYWGMDPLGLMRECGHPLLVSILALTCVAAARHGGRLARILQHRSMPWLQLPETWLMLWLTTLLNSTPASVHFAHLDALYFLINILALAALAWVAGRPLEVRGEAGGRREPVTFATAP